MGPIKIKYIMTKYKKHKNTRMLSWCIVNVRSWYWMHCSHVSGRKTTQTERRCYVECQSWVYLTNWFSNWMRAKLERSTTHGDLESPSTGLKMEVCVPTSTSDSYWMDSRDIRISAVTIPASRCSFPFLRTYTAHLKTSFILRRPKIKSSASK